MKSITTLHLRALGARVLLASAAATGCNLASALPSFTFNPGAVGLAGASFSGDNLLVSDFATVSATGTGINESGYLAITGAQLGGSQVTTGGLGSTYGLYIAFNASGTTAFNANGFQGGNFNSLTYTLYGYNGSGSFSPTSAPAPAVTLGSGSLLSGSFNSTTSGATVTSAGANTTLTFAAGATASGFFASPVPFYGLAQAAFTNTSQQITMTATGFTLAQGGGSVNFLTAPVPEPETYALMLAGLAAVAFIGRRRKGAPA